MENMINQTADREISPEKVPPSLIFLYIICFVSGTVIMTFQMMGLRLLTVYFGYSLYLWGSLIGIIMAALSLGYIFGGALSDRYPRQEVLFLLVFLAGLYSGIISFFYRPLLLFCQKEGLIYGPILSTILLFAPVMVLLSAVPTFITGIVAEKNRIGITAGKIYSISTVGSIFGIFLSSFLLLPFFGSHKTFIIGTVFILLIAITGLVFCRKFYAVLFIIIFFLFLNYSDIPYDSNAVYVRESPYSHLEIVQNDKWSYLVVDNLWYYSLYNQESLMTAGAADFYWDYYCISPVILNKSRNALILGLGGGTSLRQLIHFWPDLSIDAVEIDPVIIDIAVNKFEVPEDSPGVHIINNDARPFLTGNKEKKYDFIEIDLFQKGAFVPFYLTTEEFFSLSKEDLNPGGMIIMNVLIPGFLGEKDTGKATFFGCMGNTLSEVFPSVFYITMETYNIVFLAFRDEITLEELQARMEKSDVEAPEIQEVINKSKANIKEYVVDKNSFVLTDDRAPVEELLYPAVKARFGMW